MLELNFTPFPILITERLVLRQQTERDIDDVFFLRSDARIMKYIDREPCKSTEEAAAFIAKINDAIAANDCIQWGITLTGHDTVIGSIGIWNIAKEHYRAEIGYVLHPDHHNKNIMSEAIAAALEYGFATMKLHSMEANTHAENIASQRVLEKSGFIREGYFKENYYYAGKFLDSAVYSLITPYK